MALVAAGHTIMASKTRLYDLFIVVSTTVDEERAAKVLTDAVAQIENGGGAVERDDDWHTRPLAYEINHQGEGHYHLLQFTCDTPALLDSLSFNLRVDDAVLRHRIIRNVPGTPPVPDPPPVTSREAATASVEA